jgi:hypothetical protein
VRVAAGFDQLGRPASARGGPARAALGSEGLSIGPCCSTRSGPEQSVQRTTSTRGLMAARSRSGSRPIKGPERTEVRRSTSETQGLAEIRGSPTSLPHEPGRTRRSAARTKQAAKTRLHRRAGVGSGSNS